MTPVSRFFDIETGMFEGIYFAFKLHRSNRFGNWIAITQSQHDREFRVPQNRYASTLAKLQNGENPDEIAKGFPL